MKRSDRAHLRNRRVRSQSLLSNAARTIALGCTLAGATAGANAATVPGELIQALRAGDKPGVIVEFDSAAIDQEAATRRARLPRRTDDAVALARLASRYRALKDQVMRPVPPADVEAVRDYRQLPLAFKRVRSEAGLRALAAQSGVRALHADRLHQRVLAQSLPLVAQPAVFAAGLGGSGATVAVIDDGIDLTQAAFGGCTAPGQPASCRVAAVQTFPASPSAGSAHGTNVAAIVVGVAPNARVAALDVFTAAGALSSDVLSAIDWAIANRSSLNIVAINMSLGDGTRNTTPCSSTLTNPFATSIANARNAGISVVAAAGNNAFNNGGLATGLNGPACTPGAISVGAVYDSNVGGLTWSAGTSAQCTELSTGADQVACFSNTASYLTLLAPGALITAGGSTFGGTSQATPHVSGALAVLRANFPNETRAAVEARLTVNSTPVTDGRTGLSFGRLNLLASARPPNDNFADAAVLSGASGAALGGNQLATRESTEPQPAASAGRSIWWQWTAPAAGQISLDTTGSSFNTELDVYTGSSVAALTRVAGVASGAASPLRFQARSGTTYRWAVDGSNGSAGNVALNWALNTAAQANLSVTLNGPASALPGSIVGYTLNVANSGPQSATGVVANVALPSGISVASLPAACSTQAATITCQVAEVASGTSASFALSLRIDSLSAPVSLSAAVTSELPDPLGTNNSTTAALSVGSSQADIPTLPDWGVLLLGAVLLWHSGVVARRPKATPS
jgi:uncharacterized repeat protein (TIGR01451 family)